MELGKILEKAQRQFFNGDVAGAIETLGKCRKDARNDPLLLQQIAALYIQCGQHERAARCYERAVEIDANNPDLLYNLGASRTATGDLAGAKDLFDRAIQLNPLDYGSWLSRSGLARQKPEDNHVDELREALAHLPEGDPGWIPLCHAMAKELEDLGRHDESFRHLQEGAHLRRLGMQYDIAEDERTMSEIASHFHSGVFNSDHRGYDSERPVFILGLPRTGTTLVDRIISSHGAVDSLGEHNSLALAVLRLAGNAPRTEIVRRSTKIDFARLGREYCRAIEGFGNPAPRLIDKTPPNFLYLGLIRLSLPNAKVIHLRRGPMDACYAMYKTLFRSGYPFSYSLQETGRYYIAYHRLMAHWRAVMPGFFLDVDYENVVRDLEGQARRIIDFLGLPWEDRCLEFHRLNRAAATASAVQVREPIYSSSVGLWRKYERQLGPMAERLRERGIDVDKT